MLLFSDVVNPDRPLKGEWDLNLQRIWEVDRAGEDVFLQPDRLQAAEDGTLYLHDGMNRINYIFDPEGCSLYRSKIIVDEGLTMMPQQSANPLLTDDHLCVALMDKDSNVRITKYKINLPEPERD